MAHPHLILPPPGRTPAELKSSAGHHRALPPDLLRQASQRLGIMALLAATLWVIGTIAGHLAERAMMRPGDPRWRDLGSTDAIAAASVVASLLLFAYTRRSRRDPQFILDLGLVYMVLMGFAIGVMFHFDPPPANWEIRPEISWIGAIVLIYPAIVPSDPRKMLVASLVAVSMNPAGMLIGAHRIDYDLGSKFNVLLMHYPDYILAGVSVLISHVVTQLGRQVRKAREMGSYQLGDLIGRGGMGEVYRATHRMLARPAAIKLIRPEMLGAADSDGAQLAVKRFVREAESAANLRSPHTVEVYDFGVAEDQTLYFVMELLDGMDLETLVGRFGAMPAGRAIYILQQLCESLAEAHARGLVHRDIKPANIHVGTIALRHDFVKVLDFGLVKPVAGGNSGLSLATAAGLTPGTPAYMAPEVALGEAVDHRADIYALGCVAFYLLTGRLVFEAASMFQMVVKHLESVPDAPSEYSPSPIPPALDAAVLACLAKDPKERVQSALELSRMLAAIETAPWGEEEAARWWASVAATQPAAAAPASDGPASPPSSPVMLPPAMRRGAAVAESAERI
jgi:serine/threonine-protein kinase